MGATGAELSITAEGERRDILASSKRQLREQELGRAGEQANKRRERRRGVGRASRKRTYRFSCRRVRRSEL